MKTFSKLFLIISIAINLFLVKATVLPNPAIGQISACQITLVDPNATQGSPINVSAQGSSFRSGDWTYIQGFTVDPSKSEIELGFLMNFGAPGSYILQTTIPANAEVGATYIVRVLHDTTVNNCGTIVIGGGIPPGGNPGPNIDCTKADVNGDGKIDLLDQQAVAFHNPPTPYDAKYDLNSDGVVNNIDTDAVLFCTAPIVGNGGFGSGKNPCESGICQTALGPISTDLKDFATRILSIATGIAGGIAFILMVIGAIRILTSQGDPKSVAGGREMIIAAVAGLLFLIFSVIILRFIGLNLFAGVASF